MAEQEARKTQMKKICFFSGDITRGGGTEKAATMIANALAAEGRYQIVFLSLTEQSPTPFFSIDKNIGRHTLEKKWIYPGPGYLKVLPKLRRFLRQQGVDVIVDIDIVLDSLSLPASRSTDAKVVSWEHFNYLYEASSWYRRSILKYSVKRSAHVVTLTEKDKRFYADKLNRTEKISAIHNPLAGLPVSPQKEKENWLVTVGHLIRRKGTDLLATAALQVLQQNPGWKWLVIGDGTEKQFLENFIHRHRLNGRLILTGRTDNVAQYLDRAKVYVMTSRLEGLPMCLLEAKEFSLPIVSFDIPTGPSEMIRDNMNGFLIPPFDCGAMAQRLSQLMRDENLLQRFAAHARDDMEKFEMRPILEQWNAVLDSLTAEADGRR